MRHMRPDTPGGWPADPLLDRCRPLSRVDDGRQVSGLLPLRDYQRAAIDAVTKAWREGMQRPAIVLPTGAGKTVVFSHLIAEQLTRHLDDGHDNARALVLAHRDELIEQAVDKLRIVAPHLRVGVVKGERNEVDADAVVATVQTLASAARRGAVRDVGMIIIDEAHHATAATYRAILDHYGAPAVGVTATMARGDGAALGEVWDKIVYRRDILDMIEAGHLLPARGKRIRVPDLDLSGLKRNHGDYQDGELGEALSASLAPGLVAKAYVEHAEGRSGVLFAPTVSSAYVFADALNDAGIKTETVHGALPTHERRAILKRLREGVTQVVSNCMVLTEGFDEPRISCAIICRPTTSSSLYTQMVGRVLRPYPGQTGALVIDVVGVTGRHRLASLVDLIGDPTKRAKDPDLENLADMLLTADGLEFEGEEESNGGSRPLSFVEGNEIEARWVDLFARSHSAWLRTEAGTAFLPTGRSNLTVVIVPAGGGGRYNVGVMNVAGAGQWRYRHVQLDTAMAWGEEVARELGASAIINRKGRWRGNSESPTEGQLAKARRVGVKLAGFESKAEVADAISKAIASRLVDPIVKGWGV